MSLISSLNTTFGGIKATESKMSTVSSNVSNADQTGYTTKDYQTSYITAGGVTSPSGGIVVGSISKQLYASAIDDNSDYSYASIISNYLDLYSTAMGTTDTTTSISGSVDSLQAAIDTLATSASDSSQKTNVVSDAATLANALNSLSSTVQDYRQQANDEISTSVDTINSALQNIQDLNTQITTLQAQGQSTADLEDQRMVQLSNLSEQMDVSYFFTSTNQLKVYTTDGQPLVDSQVHALSYDASSSTSSTTTFSPITLNGVDVTSSIDGGKLGGLIQLRDTYLPQEQAKLDQFAQTLASTMNSVTNSGASYPARSDMTGDTQGISASDALNGSGTVRIATLDSSGMVTGYSDLDLSSYSTVGDLVTALNGISGVSASLTASGQLELSSTVSGEGISINQMTSSVNGSGFSSAFGLNNLYSGTDAASIKVSSYLTDNPGYLATGVLSSSATLAVGDRGVSSGDATTATALSSALSGKSTFAAAGNFTGQSTSFASYAAKIVSDAASRASAAADKSSLAETSYTQTKSLLDNAQGVNLDEQTVKLTALQTEYQSSAALVSAIKDMFDELIAAVK
ncbi:MAG: flagellar hook-associated protein FlgK [Micavibrio sp.]|nr:flagellar hook-associated protein FlgK [Micavibrio sp.]